MVRVVTLLLLLLSTAHANDWQVGAQSVLSYSGVTFATVLDTPYNTAGLRPNVGFRPGFSVRYKNYGLSMTPAISGESQRYGSYPPTLFTDFKLSYYQPAWGVDLYYQYYRGYFAEYGDSDQVALSLPSMRQSTFMLNVYGSILSWDLLLDDETIYKFRRGEGLVYFSEGIRDGSGMHMGLFYMVSGFRHNVNNSGPFFPGSAGSGSILDSAHEVGLSGASAAIGFAFGSAIGDREDILGRYSSGAAVYVGAGGHQASSDSPGGARYGMHDKIGAKGFVRYDIMAVGLGVLLSVDATGLELGSKESANFYTALLKFFFEATF